MIVWWITNQERLALERQEIDKLAEASSWLENIDWDFDDKLRLVAAANIRLAEDVITIKLIYPDLFPHSPPSVYPVERERISSHQYGEGGELCLEYRSDNWRIEFTGALLLKSAYDLLIQEAPGDSGDRRIVPSAHRTQEGIDTRFCRFRLYLTKSALVRLSENIGNVAKVTFAVHWTGKYSIKHLVSIENSGDTWTNPDLPRSLPNEGYSVEGRIYCTDKPIETFSRISDVESLFVELNQERTESISDRAEYLIVDKSGSALLFWRLANETTLLRHRTITEPNCTTDRRGSVGGILHEKRTGIVGLGSLGSKIAVSLARSGVGRIELIDNDLLHPGNMVRHDADWREVGVHKADALARRIRLLDPSIEVSCWRSSIGGQVSSQEASNVLGALAECDVIIDATASDEVFNTLAGIAMTADKSMLWSSIYAGGIGGFIARSRRRKDPEPFHIRGALLAYYQKIDLEPPIAAAAKYEAEVDGEPLIATDADVSVISAQLVEFAIDTLLEREPSEYECPLYLLGLTRSWDFDGPFDVKPINVDAPVRSDDTGSLPDEDQMKFIKDIFDRKQDEATDSTGDD